MSRQIDSVFIIQILKCLDDKLAVRSKSLHLLVGGAGALVGAYQYPDQTTDIDAVPLKGGLDEIATELQEVSTELGLPGDWMNPHYKTFTIYLPQDYRSRVKTFFRGRALIADALGPEDIMIMKFMAGRAKDQSHLRFLMKQNPDLELIEARLNELVKLFPPIAQKALDLFDEVTEG